MHQAGSWQLQWIALTQDPHEERLAMVKKCLGIDIGGANIKVADTLDYARSWPFTIWNRTAELPGFLETVLREAPPGENLAVTMTG